MVPCVQVYKIEKAVLVFEMVILPKTMQNMPSWYWKGGKFECFKITGSMLKIVREENIAYL